VITLAESPDAFHFTWPDVAVAGLFLAAGVLVVYILVRWS
jgi:hypothetical protein